MEQYFDLVCYSKALAFHFMPVAWVQKFEKIFTGVAMPITSSKQETSRFFPSSVKKFPLLIHQIGNMAVIHDFPTLISLCFKSSGIIATIVQYLIFQSSFPCFGQVGSFTYSFIIIIANS